MDDRKGNMTLFLIDDEPNMLRSLRRVLRGTEYDLHTFDDPNAALQRLNELQVGVIVTDQSMPEMPGDVLLSVATKIQPRLKGIILSGFSHKASAELGESEFKAWRYLNKPCSDNEFKDSIAEAFSEFNSA